MKAADRLRSAEKGVAPLLLVLFSLAAQGQDFALDWFTVDGGGGMSTGGQFTVSGTIGQPDAGRMSGGQFTLHGGFWPGVAVPIPGGPTVFIELAGSQVRISWSPTTAGFALEMTEDLATSEWTPVPGGGTNPATLDIGVTPAFFRLVRQ